MTEMEKALKKLAHERGFELKITSRAMRYEVYRPGALLMSMNFSNVKNAEQWLSAS